ncbi:metallophosphoesterase family protein [Corallococcus carmarthensis]|uniref:Metallophosphoesterase n=1 Tax=Corallococcus carmarthensis TaxID=2316728 RepID=A0A3A8JZJ8_9BACT|nr:metallophosphoesterase [Corallococcus carmarthensis]NOK21051.1 metallophosphoesterase [Corallococcus carmarthensis]RKH00616.1 metallophosphoesterase [Corallococcus carmarthensis]
MAVRASDVSRIPGRRTRPGPPSETPPGKPMVSWFDPAVLVKSGLKALLSGTFGRQADRRLLDAVSQPQKLAFDYSLDASKHPRDELWLDYVSDLGDGWDSTYAVASTVMAPELELTDDSGRTHVTRGGDVLVFGGDEVYPTASVEEYQARTVVPYEDALNRRRHRPHLFAVPGNHDWYDGLVSFTRLFCQGRFSSGWRTQQRRSYFALKLPHGWWLLGTDMQLESDLDAPQVRFFQKVAACMEDTDRVILCNAEPAWIKQQVMPHAGRGFLDNNIDFLERKVLGKKVSIFLAGDLHHYRRHEDADGRQKIVAGGGGAFLHPTHLPKVDRRPGGFELKECYPPQRTSQRLTWRNLLFPVLNPWFSAFMGVIYTLLGWGIAANLNEGAVGAPSFREVINAALQSTGSLVLGAGVVLGTVAFADGRRGPLWKKAAGVVHGLAHVAAALLLTWGVSAIAAPLAAELQWSLRRDFLSGLLLLGGGALVGPLVVGVYLLLSLNVFSCHPNEAFSSLSIPDWKNFLRLHFDTEGQLTVYPVGFRRVPRKWKRGSGPEDPVWVPDPADTRATPPRLIEPPIVISRTKALPVKPETGPPGPMVMMEDEHPPGGAV